MYFLLLHSATKSDQIVGIGMKCGFSKRLYKMTKDVITLSSDDTRKSFKIVGLDLSAWLFALLVVVPRSNTIGRGGVIFDCLFYCEPVIFLQNKSKIEWDHNTHIEDYEISAINVECFDYIWLQQKHIVKGSTFVLDQNLSWSTHVLHVHT